MTMRQACCKVMNVGGQTAMYLSAGQVSAACYPWSRGRSKQSGEANVLAFDSCLKVSLRVGFPTSSCQVTQPARPEIKRHTGRGAVAVKLS